MKSWPSIGDSSIRVSCGPNKRNPWGDVCFGSLADIRAPLRTQRAPAPEIASETRHVNGPSVAALLLALRLFLLFAQRGSTPSFEGQSVLGRVLVILLAAGLSGCAQAFVYGGGD